MSGNIYFSDKTSELETVYETAYSLIRQSFCFLDLTAKVCVHFKERGTFITSLPMAVPSLLIDGLHNIVSLVPPVSLAQYLPFLHVWAHSILDFSLWPVGPCIKASHKDVGFG